MYSVWTLVSIVVILSIYDRINHYELMIALRDGY